ncbi:MAG: ATP phosphoribosyltransferase regulatory subunit [Alphaproteobacteria bacterium]|nr:ATP phosphoribosyltransferase regulatory subunit [Alphaproteobacteria bacterium]
MNELPNKGLLPEGLRDVLPPDAAFEADVTSGLMTCFAGHGYERVKPPLIEFEDSLLSGVGTATARDTFRLMDPVSQHMMGVRPDMTVQVARIAATRLGQAPRPLRLCYAGQVLRARGNQIQPERQLGQAGAELIGSVAAAADVEVVRLAVESLAGIGVEEITADLNMPTLITALMNDLELDEATAEGLRAALDRKDAAAVATAGDEVAGILRSLLGVAGPADDALAVIEKLELPARAARERDAFLETARLIIEELSDVRLTVDPVETRGFEYHCGITFTLFARSERGELGWGGRYMVDRGDGGKDSAEPATGFTLFMGAVMGALPGPQLANRVYLPFGTPQAVTAGLQGEGWVVVGGLEQVANICAEARRMNCSYVFQDDDVVAVDKVS